MVEVVKRGEVDNVGIVYNFFHGHGQLDLMPDAFRAMGPYMMSINLNGVTPEAPRILPLGTGERDREILQMIADSGYDGPIGLIDHRLKIDAEVSLWACRRYWLKLAISPHWPRISRSVLLLRYLEYRAFISWRLLSV